MKDSDLEKQVLKGQRKKAHGEVWILLVVLVVALAAAGGIFYLKGGVKWLYDVTHPYIYVGGQAYDRDITEITLSGEVLKDYSPLAEFENLQKLDLRGQEISAEQFEQISEMLSGVEILWSVPVNNARYDSNIESFTITPDMPTECFKMIKYFTSLKFINSEYYPLCDELYAVKQSIPEDSECVFNCKARIYDIEVDDSTTELILNNMKISDLSELHSAIKFFPNITKIEMCDCGFSNEEMGTLREQYPQVQFVWKIKFLHYTVRTDVQVFSTLVDVGDSFVGNQNDFSPLFKYCTELRALDLGHHYITDISEIVNLKKLQVLILADNRITDISPLAELTELNYVELFFNRFTDLTPLTKLPKLEDVNICFNRRVTNPTVMTECKNLKRLYISGCALDKNEIATLKAGLPEGCELNTWTDNAVNTGWRNNKKNAALRKAFYRWKKVESFEDWEHITYK